MNSLYVAHSTHFDFKAELYQPLKEAFSHKVKLIFPHESSGKAITNSREIIKTAVAVLAETSYPATGMGIELGWADAAGIPIINCHKTGSKSSRSVALIEKHHFEYANPKELVTRLSKILQTEAVY